MFKIITAVISRDLKLAMRRQADIVSALFFFIIVVSLFPLGIGPEPDLLRKLACRGKHKRTNDTTSHASFFDHWQCKCCGLARSGICQTDHIFAFKRKWDTLILNWRRQHKPKVRQRRCRLSM